MRLTVSWKDFALACLSGALLIPSFPTFDLGLVAWVGLVPLLIALEGKGPVAACLLSFTTGLILCPGIFHWALSIKD
jgi:apolipoprotein N-acyltransferase